MEEILRCKVNSIVGILKGVDDEADIECFLWFRATPAILDCAEFRSSGRGTGDKVEGPFPIVCRSERLFTTDVFPGDRHEIKKPIILRLVPTSDSALFEMEMNSDVFTKNIGSRAEGKRLVRNVAVSYDAMRHRIVLSSKNIEDGFELSIGIVRNDSMGNPTVPVEYSAWLDSVFETKRISDAETEVLSTLEIGLKEDRGANGNGLPLEDDLKCTLQKMARLH